MMVRSTRLLILAATVVAVAGCGGPTVSAQKAEALVKRSLDQKATSVKCPNGLAIKKGASFKCHIVYANGDLATVTLHETNNNGEVAAGSNDLEVNTIGAAAARGVVLSWAAGRKIALATVTCPPRSPAAVGGSIQCQAVDRAGKKATITLGVVNRTGAMRVSGVQSHG